jgi:carbon-monoxide dehydrogenase small subunit
MKHEITLTVNGETLPIDVSPNDVLLDTLRTQIGVKSPKVGCERGDCGSCTILLDGANVRSCLILAIEVDGHHITTVEGLSHDGLSALQEELIAASSFQCGFCAPGIVLVAAELLEREPEPTRDQVREAISGNLCRCTGYDPIVDAVLALAEREGSAS